MRQAARVIAIFPFVTNVLPPNGLLWVTMVVLTAPVFIGDSVIIQKVKMPEESMAEALQEKRAARRFALQIPITVTRGEESSAGESAEIRDVSARGICFYLESAVEQGSPIGFTLTLPPEITLTESIRVQCKGHVVRVDNGRPDGKLVVAAVIEEYEFLPEA